MRPLQGLRQPLHALDRQRPPLPVQLLRHDERVPPRLLLPRRARWEAEGLGREGRAGAGVGGVCGAKGLHGEAFVCVCIV